jgi:aryl-alcohol dehydrogenase-like predicted oxidoreductase
VTVLQTEYSVFERDVETVLPTTRELGIGFGAYSPLGRGFLTSAVKPAAAYEHTDMRHLPEESPALPGNRGIERSSDAAVRPPLAIDCLLVRPEARLPHLPD